MAVSLARKAEKSSDSSSLRRVHGRVTYSKKNVLVPVAELTSPLTLQKDLTTKWNIYARTGLPKYVIVHRERVNNEAEDCVVVGSLEPFRKQTVDEMAEVEWKIWEGEGFPT